MHTIQESLHFESRELRGLGIQEEKGKKVGLSWNLMHENLKELVNMITGCTKIKLHSWFNNEESTTISSRDTVTWP